jgi:hypothetical protein
MERSLRCASLPNDISSWIYVASLFELKQIGNSVLNCTSLSQATTCSNTWLSDHCNKYLNSPQLSGKIFQHQIFPTTVQQRLQTDVHSDFKRRSPDTKRPWITCYNKSRHKKDQVWPLSSWQKWHGLHIFRHVGLIFLSRIYSTYSKEWMRFTRSSHKMRLKISE